MTSADPVPGGLPRGAAARARGFSLIEVMVAFAIMALALSLLTVAQNQAVNNAAKALDLREVRGASDTVFRRFIYEIDRVNDGDTAGLDTWYAEYIGLRGAVRDRWSIYRGVVHKQRGLAAGTDPTGKAQPLFQDGTSGSSSSSSSSSSSRTSGSSTASGAAASDQSTAEEVYLLSLEVYHGTDENEPVMTLRTIVPIPASELENEK